MKRLALIAAVGAMTLLVTGVALGEAWRSGNLIISFTGSFAPHALPRDREVPVRVDIAGSMKTADGERPPALRGMSFAVDRHGRVSTLGLPVCDQSQLEGTSSDEALSRCRGALVGRGSFGANVDFPDLVFPVEGRILAFNSRARGRPAIVLHIYGATPVEVTFILILHINHPPRGTFGTVLSTRIPRLAADLGYVTDFSLSFGRRYRHEGQPRSFISARCAAPAGFPGALFNFVRGSFTFANEKTLTTTLARDCAVR